MEARVTAGRNKGSSTDSSLRETEITSEYSFARAAADRYDTVGPQAVPHELIECWR